MVTAIVGVWRAGAAYLPVDPAYPAARRALLLADSGARVLVSGPGVDAGEDDAVRRIVLGGRSPDVAPMPAVAVGAGMAAYVIYTSGSTGQPKGVVVTHGGLANYVSWAARRYQVRAGGAGAPLHGSLAFDLTVTSVLVPLVAGAAVIASRDGGAEGLAGLLARYRFEVVKVVPAHLPVLAGLLPGARQAGLGWGAAWRGWWLMSMGRRRLSWAVVCMRSAPGRRSQIRFRWAARWPIPGCLCWMGGCVRCRPGWPVSCMSRGRSWRVVMRAGRG